MNRRADSCFVYLLEAERQGPGLSVESEIDALAVEPGGVAELKIKLSRRDFTGSVQFQIEGLRPGFEAESLSVGEKLNDGVIRIRIAKDAVPGNFSTIRMKTTLAGGDPIFCSTRTALAKRWPRMRQTPEFLDGLICVSVKAR